MSKAGFGIPLLLLVACTSSSPSSPPAPDGTPLACGSRPGQHGDFEIELPIREAGQTRKYQVHVPPGLSLAEPAPVVLAFHGGGEFSLAIALGTSYLDKADAEGFILVRPEGVNSLPGAAWERRTWNAGTCCGFALDQGVDDVAYVNQLLDDLETRYCVDTKRVFATGISNGALMTYRLACEASSRIAAIAPVAGPLMNRDYSSCQEPCDTATQRGCLTSCVEEDLPLVFPCRPERPVPVMHVHGALDASVPLEGGVGRNETTGTTFPSAAMNLERWRQLDGCTEATRIDLPSPQAVCEVFTECREGATVSQCTVFDGGHTWPGGDWDNFVCHPESAHYDPLGCLEYQAVVGPLSRSFDAVTASWDFFSRHPMP